MEIRGSFCGAHLSLYTNNHVSNTINVSVHK